MTETTMHHIHKIETSSYQDTRIDGSKYSVTKIKYYSENGDRIHQTTVFGKPQLKITKEAK